MGDLGSIPGLGRFFWRRARQPTPDFLPGESPWTEGPGRLQSMGSQRVGHDWANKTALHSTGDWTSHEHRFTCNRWSLAIFKSLLWEAHFCIFQCGLWDDICWYMFVVIMNYHKFRGLDNRNLLSHVSGGQNLKLAEIKELAGRSGSSWRLQRSLFPCSSGSRDTWIVWFLDPSSVFEAGDGQYNLTPCHSDSDFSSVSSSSLKDPCDDIGLTWSSRIRSLF